MQMHMNGDESTDAAYSLCNNFRVECRKMLKNAEWLVKFVCEDSLLSQGRIVLLNSQKVFTELFAQAENSHNSRIIKSIDAIAFLDYLTMHSLFIPSRRFDTYKAAVDADVCYFQCTIGINFVLCCTFLNHNHNTSNIVPFHFENPPSFPRDTPSSCIY